MAKDTDGLHMPKFKTAARRILYFFRPKIKNLKYYSKCKFNHAFKRNVFYLVFEPNKKHPGLADRLKAILSCYDWAKLNGYQFKVYFETPFCLEDYLKPKFDWPAKLEELEYSVYDTKIINEYYREKPIKLIPNKQYHCYNYAGHHMPKIFPDSGYKFSELFHEMFEPCNEIINSFQNLNTKPGSYVSCHLRFVNALEKFENTFFENYLNTQEERDALIFRCKNGIKQVIDNNPNKNVYVFSDSKVFLESLIDMPVLVLPYNHVAHVSEGAQSNAIFKSFLDLYVMSKGSAVYRFQAKELYSISHYALLAATIGELPFYDLNV